MCARAVSVAVQDIQGVQSVEVSLNDGLAVVTFFPANRAPVAEIRKAIRENGFSPKGADVRMEGLVERTPAGLYLRIAEGDNRFRMERHPDAQQLGLDAFVGRTVVVEAGIPESDGGDAGPLTLLVRTARPAGQP